jgi:MscS family membrane protein
MDILARLPAIDVSTIPGAPGKDWGTLPEKWNIPGTDIQIAKVDKGLRAGDYLFTTDTVQRLPYYHALIIDQPPLRPTAHENWHQVQINFTGPLFDYGLLNSIPAPLLHTIVLDTPAWKLAIAVAVALLSVGITIAWFLMVRRAVRGATRLRRLYGQITTPLFILGLLAVSDGFFGRQLSLAGAAADAENIMSAVIWYVAAAWAAWIACYLVIEAVIETHYIHHTHYDIHLLRLAARVLSILSAGAILFYGANDVGIPALGVVAGLSIGGLAFALASQSTVENLFGGVSIFADRPFRVGDFIRFGEDAGTVEAIGPRSARVRAIDGTLTTVPNGGLAKMSVTNISARGKCLFHHIIGLRYETSTTQFRWLIEEITGLLTSHPVIEKSPGFPRVALTGFHASSINIEIRANVLTRDFNEFLKIQQALLLAIMEAVDAAGTGFAFPSQTVYLARDTGLNTNAKARVEAERRAGPADAGEFRPTGAA